MPLLQEMRKPTLSISAVAASSIYPAAEALTVRLTGTTASDVFYMDDLVIWPVERTEYDLPAWVEDPRDVLAVGYYERGQQLVGSNTFMLGEKQFVPLLQDPRNEIDELGANA